MDPVGPTGIGGAITSNAVDPAMHHIRTARDLGGGAVLGKIGKWP